MSFLIFHRILLNLILCVIVFFFYYFSIARGQKIPIFSAAGLPHNDVSVQE